MKKVDILVLEKDAHRVAEALGELGAVHFTEARHDDQAQLLQKPQAAELYHACSVLLEQAANLSKRLYVEEQDQPLQTEFVPLEMIGERLRHIDESVRPVLQHEDAVNAEVDALNDAISQISAFRRLNVAVEEMPAFSFLHFATGRMPAEKLSAVEAEAGPGVVIVRLETTEEGDAWLVAVTSKKGRWAMESILEKQGFRPEALNERFHGVPEEIYEHAIKRLDALQGRKEELAAELKATGARYGDELARYRRRLRIEQRVLQAEESFGRTSATFTISGWIPQDKADELNRKLTEITGSRMVIEMRDPDPGQEDVPILLKHGRLIRPFELLVSNYGLPGYREIEPTIIVAASFLVMFGIMFADVGQGAVLAIGGFLMSRSKLPRRFRSFGTIAVFAGIAAAIGGLLFGEFFGYELFPPLWMEVLKGDDPLVLLAWCVVLGMVMNSMGMVLNVVNHFRRGRYAEGILDKFGVAGMVFYWGALWMAARGLGVLSAVGVPAGGPSLLEAVPLLVVPAAAIVLRPRLMRLLLHKESHGGADAYIESGMDVFEMVIGFMSSTVSYVRVGAFALAHAGLGAATYSLAGMVTGSALGMVFAALIVITGNVVIIAFEGLVVSIQCIRLEYYEFFAKFFKGEGKPFTPFSLRTEP